MQKCECLSGSSAAECCDRLINQGIAPSDAKELMRSRYTAFKRNDIDYLEYSWASQHCPSRTQLQQSMTGTEWIGLLVHEHESINESTQQVEFSAFYLEQGGLFELRERSSFILESNRWVYQDGEISRGSGKIKNPGNLPCPCQSGKKFKRCHGSRR